MQSFKFISFSVFEKIEVLNLPSPPLILPRPNDPPQKTQPSTNRVWFVTVSIILPKMPILGSFIFKKVPALHVSHRSRGFSQFSKPRNMKMGCIFYVKRVFLFST